MGVSGQDTDAGLFFFYKREERDNEIDTETSAEIGKMASRQTDRQTGIWVDIQTDRHMARHTGIHRTFLERAQARACASGAVPQRARRGARAEASAGMALRKGALIITLGRRCGVSFLLVRVCVMSAAAGSALRSCLVIAVLPPQQRRLIPFSFSFFLRASH